MIVGSYDKMLCRGAQEIIARLRRLDYAAYLVKPWPFNQEIHDVFKDRLVLPLLSLEGIGYANVLLTTKDRAG